MRKILKRTIPLMGWIVAIALLLVVGIHAWKIMQYPYLIIDRTTVTTVDN